MSSAKLQDLIHDADFVSLQQAMTSSECTSEALVLAYIEHIHRYNPLITECIRALVQSHWQSHLLLMIRL